MPLHIIRHDITLMPVDAIVSPGNEQLYPDGGVAALIIKRGGPRLAEACQRLGGVETGRAKLTRGFNLPCRYVIHTAGPRWQGGGCGEDRVLRAAYRACLEIAADRHVSTLAIPLISTGKRGYPVDRALDVAVREIRAFLSEQPEKDEMTVSLVTFSEEAFQAGSALHREVRAYIDASYAERMLERRRRVEFRRYDDEASALPNLLPMGAAAPEASRAMELEAAPPAAAKEKRPVLLSRNAATPRQEDLRWQLEHMEETFSQQLLRLIDERGMSDSACYKRANIDRKLFSKIRSNADYKPSKPTALAFAVALCLTLPETCELIGRAGYTLTHASKFDIIVEFFISRGIYDVDQINIMLFEEQMPRLGS